jgi:hypothetical protein
MPMPTLPAAADFAATSVGDMPRPRPAQRAQLGGQSRAKLPPNAPFFLCHHRDSWEVSTTLEQPVLLPNLTRFVVSAGSNGCRTVTKGEDPILAYQAAVDIFRRRGYTFIDPHLPIPSGCLPAGVEAGGYLREIDAEHPVTQAHGTHYLEAWTQIVASDDARTAIAWDRRAYERWLVWLVESGVIRPAGPGVASRLVAMLDARLERAMTLALAPDLRERRVAAATARLEAAQHAAGERTTLQLPPDAEDIVEADELAAPSARRGKR